MGIEVVDDRVDPLRLRRDPPLDVAEEVGPVGRQAAAVGAVQLLAGGRAGGAKDVPLAAAAIVNLLIGTAGRAAAAVGARALRVGADELSAGVAPGRLRLHLVEADDG